MTPLQKFQEKIGVNPDNDFGAKTLNAGVKFLGLTKEQGAHFFAQLSHETGEFKLFEENLNYSATGLLRTFSKYFKSALMAQAYARKPEKIASLVYANRMGNRSELSGDGWKYRGRGFLQLTGKSNYEAFANWKKDLTVISKPELIIDEYAMDSALFFFERNNLWSICSVVNDSAILSLSRAINLGNRNSKSTPNGLAHRKQLTYKYYELLK